MSHSIQSESDPAGHVIAVTGEADASASPGLDDALRGAVLSAVADGGERTIIVDLSEASFVDSRTIGVLVSWSEQLEPKGWRMPIVCTDPKMLGLFGVLGLEATFDFFDSREEAAAGASGSDG